MNQKALIYLGNDFLRRKSSFSRYREVVCSGIQVMFKGKENEGSIAELACMRNEDKGLRLEKAQG